MRVKPDLCAIMSQGQYLFFAIHAEEIRRPCGAIQQSEGGNDEDQREKCA